MVATSLSLIHPIILRNGIVSFIFRRRNPTRFYCKCSEKYRVPPEYAERFSKRMSLAAVKPHHRIAMGVSGGADSMALCALMAHWKTCSNDDAVDRSGFINGLLAIIIDHGLRLESKDESETVSHWVTEMGIRCEVARCDWPNGLPKVGHLEEAARDMRYQIFHNVCSNNRIGLLLTAHHADDQAELFVLRLSRNSGVLGLAGMASTSQIFPDFSKFTVEPSNSIGLLLIRPLLDFVKDDLYKICESNNQNWVEDPTNKSSLFARNRIRMALQDLNTSAFRSELHALIAVCRQTRLYVDHICQILLKEAVTIMPHGYAIIDLESLNPSAKTEICLSRFLALILQFISQRNRPVRGSASKLLVQYIQSFPCKTSLTAAGCYLAPAPGSKGTKVLVCCCSESSRTTNTELYSKCRGRGSEQQAPCGIEDIITNQKSETKYLVPDPLDVHFLSSSASYSVVSEARKLKMLSDSTFESIAELQIKEKQIFKSKKEVLPEQESKHGTNSLPPSREAFRPGESCYFKSRFFLTWTLDHEGHYCDLNNGEKAAGQLAYIRHMIDEDWLYLANLLKAQDSDNGVEKLCLSHARLSAEQALRILKPIPAAARRGLPVMVSKDSILLSIPSVGFSRCPSLTISIEFRPRVPLGGGHTSFT
ncbi:hypothetical protein KSS87_011426 [Heliosperma pusillum]|nr:hypothetical protein KSS87_011426 [Heliosperma pusillum]